LKTLKTNRIIHFHYLRRRLHSLPGKSGPLDSIRFEALRDGVEDYEMLKLLLERGKVDEAVELCNLAVRSITEYVRTPKEFLSIRLKLIERLESIG